MADDVAIKVSNVSKTFILPHEKSSSVKSAFINFYRKKKGYEKQQVLNDISFEIKKGEFFGIVGRNGSGKSTLLKLLAGIYTPDSGDIQINGKLTPFIELGVGFNPELSGRENVFLNGALLGFSRKEMEAMYSEIVEFAELERFMDQKLKNYSSGMQVRLAFSIAIRANTDVLVLDEVLAVGDAAFQEKCYKYFERLKKDKKTVVLVTHDMDAVRRFCTRALMIKSGDIKAIGSTNEIASQYMLDNMNKDSSSEDDKGLSEAVSSFDFTPISSADLRNTENLEFTVSYKLAKSVPVKIGLSILYHGIPVLEQSTGSLTLGSQKDTSYKLQYKLPLNMFTAGDFKISVAIFEKKDSKLIGFNTDAFDFIVSDGPTRKRSMLRADGVWEKL